jgi:hypothetical protein
MILENKILILLSLLTLTLLIEKNIPGGGRIGISELNVLNSKIKEYWQNLKNIGKI